MDNPYYSLKKWITYGFNFYIYKDLNWRFLKFRRLGILPQVIILKKPWII